MPNPTPMTIRELQAWYAAHQLPPEEVTRFFIGKDIREPRAFGIYQDGDRFVVYKNKADGSRAVRYQGPDEAYAVRELYTKLKQEIAAQKGRNAEAKAWEADRERKSQRLGIVIAVAVTIAVVGFSFWSEWKKPNRGYYRFDDGWYYYQNDLWYLYDGDYWQPCAQAPAQAVNWSEAYQGEQYTGQNGITDFELTQYYAETDTDSTWDSSDSWDSGTTDWSSDW